MSKLRHKLKESLAVDCISYLTLINLALFFYFN